MSNTAFKDLSPEELDDLIHRVTEAQKHELALSFEDCQLLIDALLTLATLHEKLSDNEITIAKLRKLAGIIRSSEKLSRQLGRGETKKSRSGRNKKDTPDLRPEVVKHPLTEQNKGDQCPECGKGTLHKYEPATLLRITDFLLLQNLHSQYPYRSKVIAPLHLSNILWKGYVVMLVVLTLLLIYPKKLKPMAAQIKSMVTLLVQSWLLLSSSLVHLIIAKAHYKTC